MVGRCPWRFNVLPPNLLCGCFLFGFTFPSADSLILMGISCFLLSVFRQSVAFFGKRAATNPFWNIFFSGLLPARGLERRIIFASVMILNRSRRCPSRAATSRIVPVCQARLEPIIFIGFSLVRLHVVPFEGSLRVCRMGTACRSEPRLGPKIRSGVINLVHRKSKCSILRARNASRDSMEQRPRAQVRSKRCCSKSFEGPFQEMFLSDRHFQLGAPARRTKARRSFSVA